MCLGIPGQIVEITDVNQKLALVNVGGVKRQVNIACIIDDNYPAESCVGDWVLIHVGFALNRIDEQEAAETLQLLKEIADTQEDLLTTNS
jgi:hydrogenase expression/formation protein HypC